MTIVHIDVHDMRMHSTGEGWTRPSSTVACWNITQQPGSTMIAQGNSWDIFRVTLLEPSTGSKAGRESDP